PVAMFLAALSAASDLGVQPNFNMKIIMDFEEELGSPRLAETVVKNRDALAADMLVIFDGPRHISNQPTLTYGARGIATLALEVFGPRAPQHSGHYGNYAPNPALRLAELLASMKDEEGRVVLPGWYDGITLSDEVREILRQVPDDEEEIKRKIGIAKTDAVAGNYQESMQYPSLNILGLESGWVGSQTRTIIPSSATAAMDIRLVRESDPEALVGKVMDHIRGQGYHFVENEPTDEERQKHDKLIRVQSRIAYQAFRTDFDTEIGSWLRRAMNRAFGKDPIQIRTAGGSIPIAPFVSTLGLPAVIVPTVNPDNNQHSPNENVRLGNYVEGVKTMIAILETQL
ncbi:MAG: M20/M25/M40 family metallo-hydrolase, partial [Candidatus Eisenbacteria bacterium]|nr:M20/M25/M40 family metallo-hydrolase [Candidatus Eisenbacteria bacterium]